MIYGINFNGQPIPDTMRKKFAAQRKFDLPWGQYAVLRGVGQSPEERNAMVIQATNATRRIWVIERKTAGGVWYGVYTH